MKIQANPLFQPSRFTAIHLLAALALATLPALATDFTWNGGGGDNNWTTGDNWGGTPPTPANTATLIFNGTTRPSPFNDFANNSLFSGITFANTNDGESFTLDGSQITIAGAGIRSSANVTTGSITDTIDLGLRLNTNLLWGMGTNHHLTINGVVSEVSSATPRSVAAYQGAGTLSLTNAGNSFTGETAAYNAATLALTSIANSTVPSAAGAGSTIRLGASGSGSGGVLVYTGSGSSSTDRIINLASSLNSTATINNNGSGTLVFAGPFTNGATAGQTKTLQLGGTNTGANAIQSDLSDGGSGGTLALSITDSGAWTITGNNSHSGGTSKSGAGQLNIGHANALGGGTFSLASGTIDNSSGAPLGVPNTVSLTGNPSFAGTEALTLSGSLTLGGSGTDRTIQMLGSSLTLSGDISGSFGLIQTSVGSLVLTGNNSFTGNLRAQNGGNITIDSIANSGLPSAAGAGTIINLGSSGTSTPGNLGYVGAGHSTNRTIALVSTGAASASILSNGTGALVLNGPFTNSTTTGSKTLRLGGDNTDANEISSVLGDDTNGGNLAVLKQEAGNWLLTAANTYTGTTTVNQGVLQVGNGGTTGSLSTSSLITVSTDGTLCFNRSNTVIQGVDFTAAPISISGTLEIKGGGTLEITDNTIFDGGANVAVASGSKLNLNYAGSETVATLTLGGVQVSGGPHNATTDPDYIIGGGSFFVQTGPVTSVPDITSIQLAGSGDVILTLDGPVTGLTVQQSNDLGVGSFTDVPSTEGANTLTVDSADVDPDSNGRSFFRVRN